MTKTQLLDALQDLADDSGMNTDEYIAGLFEQKEKNREEKFNGLDEDIKSELISAREIKSQKRQSDRDGERKTDMDADISRFKVLFPGVTEKDIPESVWAEVAEGISLCHAYSLYNAENNLSKSLINEKNLTNANKSAAVNYEGDSDIPVTAEQVEKMSSDTIKKNFKGIANSIKNWRL